MRLVIAAALVFSVTALASPLPEAPEAQPQDATSVLAAARAALGGTALDGIRSFTMTGSSVTRVLESMISWRTVEISVELPDKFLCLRRGGGFDLEGGYPRVDYQGFNGAALIDSAMSLAVFTSASELHMILPSAPLPRPAEVEPSAEHRLRQQKQVFLRLMLPLFASSPAGISLHTESGGQTLLDGRLTDVVVLKMIDGTAFRLYVDAATHLPLKLAWTASTVSRDEMVTGLPAMARPVPDARDGEWAITFSDYKTEAGVTWPRRLITWVDGRKFEDVRLRGYRINVPISARTFDPRQ